MIRSHRGRGAPALALALTLGASACVDSPVAPHVSPVAPGAASLAVQCTVDVQRQTLACTGADPAQAQLGIAANRMMGGQDTYVKLANSGTSYDSGTGVFQTNVTVQNLLADALGTPDGTTVAGVQVFFYSGPTASGGSGEVTVLNADGHDFFTAASQPYFEYAQILAPYEISNARPWQFSVPATVTRFTFTVYVTAPQADESRSLLDRVWTGMTSTDWTTASNWKDGAVPDSGSVVSIPNDTLMAGTFMPGMGADAQVTHLRVGTGSSLDLGGTAFTVWGNVDAMGPVTGGTLRMGGAGSLLRGTVPSLRITGGVRLQGAATATGAVSVQDGALNVADRALSISIP